jgi:hypothetical protein
MGNAQRQIRSVKIAELVCPKMTEQNCDNSTRWHRKIAGYFGLLKGNGKSVPVETKNQSQMSSIELLQE